MAKKAPLPPSTFALHGDLDVFSIHGQWEALQTHLATMDAATRGDGVQLELGGLSDVDLSGIQLLLVLQRDLQAEGVKLRLGGAKAEWIARFQPLGLAELLGQEQA